MNFQAVGSLVKVGGANLRVWEELKGAKVPIEFLMTVSWLHKRQFNSNNILLSLSMGRANVPMPPPPSVPTPTTFVLISLLLLFITMKFVAMRYS